MEQHDRIAQVRQYIGLIVRCYRHLKFLNLPCDDEEKRIMNILNYLNESGDLPIKARIVEILKWFKEIERVYHQNQVFQASIAYDGLRNFILGLSAR